MKKQRDMPDSARAWAIAFADCFINALLFGLTRTAGLLYVALIKTYGVSRFQANLPFTIREAVRNLAGPLAGALGQRFGNHTVILLGGILAPAGILLCTWAPDVPWITFLWGIGSSLCSLGLITVTRWFTKHKATGVGIAISGSCLGSLALPVVIQYTLDSFGLFGCFLIISALILNVFPAAFIMKDPPWAQKRTLSETSTPPFHTSIALSSEGASLAQQCPLSDRTDKVGGELNLQENDFASNLTHWISNPVYESSVEVLPDVKTHQTEVKNHAVGDRPKLSPSNGDRQETSLRKAVLAIGRDPMFYMISISFSAMALILDPVFIILVDFLLDKGFTEEVAKYFITSLAAGDLIGRLSFGWVTDRKFLSVTTYMQLMQLSQGITFLLLPVFDDLYVLMFIITLFGLITGAALVMIPVLVQTYLKSVQSLAMGFISFGTGLTALIVPYLIGYFRDEIGSYDGLIYVSGGITVAVSFLWIFEPLLVKCRTEVSKGKELIVSTA